MAAFDHGPEGRESPTHRHIVLAKGEDVSSADAVRKLLLEARPVTP